MTSCLVIFLLMMVMVVTRTPVNAFIPVTKTMFPSLHSTALQPPLGDHPLQPPYGNCKLYMAGNGNNFWNRIARVAKANVNKIVGEFENPEKIIVQAVEDMQSDLIQIRQAYAEATANRRRWERQKMQTDAEADDWYRRADVALRNNRETLAREALARRQVLLEKSQGYQNQIESLSVATDKLHEAMTVLESKIQQAAAKKEQLIARAKTAKSTQVVNDMLNGLLRTTGKTSMDAFARMEAKVEAMEAAAEVSAEMGSLSMQSSLEGEFRALELSSQVDRELEKLQKELNESRPKRLEAATTSFPLRSYQDQVAVSSTGQRGSMFTK